mgnify:CR=1 FL=1
MLIEKKLYERILEKKKKLASIRPLNKEQLMLIKEQMEIEYVYNSTSIEGNTLSLKETRLILEEGVTISGKSLREHLDVINQKEAISWIEEFIKNKTKIKESDILELHRLTLKGISNYWAGKYKTSQNRILGSKLKTTPPYKVHSEIDNLVYKIENNREFNTIELAAYAHHELVKIHPFIDGNGRTARLLMNLVLMREGYPPIVILKKERKKYFDSLEKAHFGDFKDFFNFVAKAVERSLNLYLNALIPTTKDNELIPLRELAKETKYSQEYLSLRARQNKLNATKINGIWYASREELKDYQDKKYRMN